jgi:hypothetical protein
MSTLCLTAEIEHPDPPYKEKCMDNNKIVSCGYYDKENKNYLLPLSLPLQPTKASLKACFWPEEHGTRRNFGRDCKIVLLSVRTAVDLMYSKSWSYIIGKKSLNMRRMKRRAT